MDLEHTAPSADAEIEALAIVKAAEAPRPRRRRKLKSEGVNPQADQSADADAPIEDALEATMAQSDLHADVVVPQAAAVEPEINVVSESKSDVADSSAPAIGPAEAAVAAGETVAVRHAISILPVRAHKSAPGQSTSLKKHGALAAGMVLALAFGAYAGTQIGAEHSTEAAIDVPSPSVNVAAALPWKRDVAMATTQTREIGRLKDELRTVRAQIDALKSNPDQTRQAQDLKSLRATLDTLKENLAATRTDTANALAQVSSVQATKPADHDQQRVEKISERLERLERQLADTTATSSVPRKNAETTKAVALADPHALPTPADVAASMQKADSKPKVLRNYVVREVADGVALIEGPDGLREVWPGRGIPGAGKVTSIERQAGKWVVITSEGTIEYKRDAYLSAR